MDKISPGFAENTTILSIAAYTNHNEAMKLLISPLAFLNQTKVKHLFLVWEDSLLEKMIILENGGTFKYIIYIIYIEGYPAVQFPVYHLSNEKTGLWLFRVKNRGMKSYPVLPSYEGIIS